MSVGTVYHNKAKNRFEAGEEPHLAKLEYTVQGGSVDMFHTEVPAQYQGQGLGGKLAKEALDWARLEGLKVIPGCPFVKSYIQKHHELADLVGA